MHLIPKLLWYAKWYAIHIYIYKAIILIHMLVQCRRKVSMFCLLFIYFCFGWVHLFHLTVLGVFIHKEYANINDLIIIIIEQNLHQKARC